VDKLLLLEASPGWAANARDTLISLGVPVTLGIIFLPFGLALLSRSLLAVLATFLLSAASLILLLHPESITASIVGLAALGGSLFIAVSGFAWRHRRMALKDDLGNLRERLSRLEHADQRQVLANINLQGRADQASEASPMEEERAAASTWDLKMGRTP
jgi:hypothetical protein